MDSRCGRIFLSFHLDFSLGSLPAYKSLSCLLDHQQHRQTGARWFVRGMYVMIDMIITRSRLSTSTLKPEIMGTSMTAMLDEPEWSHLDRELRLELIRI